MLPSAARLRRSSEFTSTTRFGQRAGSGLLVIHMASADGPTRAGFVVGKAVGGAVVRNRVKRRLRHLVAARLSTLPSATQLVVRALPAAGAASAADLAAGLDAALARLQRAA